MTVTYSEWVRSRYCTDKRRHATQLQANAAVLVHWSRGDWAWAYPCEYCEGFHVTSDPTTKEGKP